MTKPFTLPVSGVRSIWLRRPCRKLVRSSSGSSENKSPEGSGVVNEDVLLKLRRFEEENAKLKAKLAAQDAGLAETQEDSKKAARIDGQGMKRETMFTDPMQGQSGNWLSEADVDFFTGGGAFESGKGEMSEDAQAVVNKRVLIGTGLAVLAGVFALIPTESLDGTAGKPLSFYLVPVVRSMNLLEDLATEIEEGRFDSIPLVVSRVLNKPNEVRKNMYSAIEFISSGKDKQNAREVVSNFVDYVQQADFNTYFDTLSSNRPTDGKQNAKFAEFSLQSVRSAVRAGKEFLAYFPSSEVRNARSLADPNSS